MTKIYFALLSYVMNYYTYKYIHDYKKKVVFIFYLYIYEKYINFTLI